MFEAVEVGSVTPAQQAMIERIITVKLAGPEAERRFTGRRNHIGAGGDHEQVVDWVFRIQPHDKVAAAWFRYLEINTRVLVDSHWQEIEAVADALIEKQTLTGLEVLDAIRSTWGTSRARMVPTPVPPRSGKHDN